MLGGEDVWVGGGEQSCRFVVGLVGAFPVSPGLSCADGEWR